MTVATKLEWRKVGSRHLAFPYQVVLWGNRFQVWRRAPNSPDDGRKTPKGWTARYTVIAAGFAHLDDAKARAQAHADSTECAL